MSIGVTTALLFIVFGVLLFLGVPISVSIIVSSIVTVMSTLSWDQITFITMQKMNSGVESFSLLAIPLFILAGNIMNNGGIAKRLIALRSCSWEEFRETLHRQIFSATCCSERSPAHPLRQLPQWEAASALPRRSRAMILPSVRRQTLRRLRRDF